MIELFIHASASGYDQHEGPVVYYSIGYNSPNVNFHYNFPSSTTDPNNTREVQLTWALGTDMYWENCVYGGDWITITNSWGGNVRYESNSSRYNRNGTAYITLPSENDLKNYSGLPWVSFNDDIRYTIKDGEHSPGEYETRIYAKGIYQDFSGQYGASGDTVEKDEYGIWHIKGTSDIFIPEGWYVVEDYYSLNPIISVDKKKAICYYFTNS